DIGDMLGGLFGRRGGGRPRRQPQNVEQPVEVTLEEASAGTTRTLVLEGENGHMRRIEVKIPAGVTTGSRVRIAGEGRDHLDGAPAEHHLSVTMRAHDRD